jgi:hypothetical protein
LIWFDLPGLGLILGSESVVLRDDALPPPGSRHPAIVTNRILRRSPNSRAANFLFLLPAFAGGLPVGKGA